MLLTRGDVVAGIDAIRLRNALRGIDVVSVPWLAAALSLSAEEAMILLGRLLEEGYLQAEPVRAERCEQPRYILSPRGSALAGARIGRPIARVKAEQLLYGVVERARAVNATEDCPCYVAGLAVYGSFQKGAAMVGDIDIATLILDRSQPGQERMDRSFAFATKHGRNRIWGEGFFYGLTWVRNQLKGRSQYISLMAADDPLALGVQADEIYAARWDPVRNIVVEEPPGEWSRRVAAASGSSVD